MQHLVQMTIVAQGNPARFDIAAKSGSCLLNPICRAYGSSLQKMERHRAFDDEVQNSFSLLLVSF